TSSALNQVWMGSSAAFKSVYVVCTAFTSGTASAQLGLSAAPYAQAILNTVNVAGTISATNPSVSTDGSAIPTSSTLIGAKDGSGNLQPVQTDGTYVLVKDANSAAIKSDLDTIATNTGTSATQTTSTATNTGTIAGAVSGSKMQNNVAQFGGSAVVTGTGASGSGIPRVTVSNDSNVQATQSGTWTVQPGNTANTTPWLTSPQVASSGGGIPYHNITAATTNFTNTKAVACQLYDCDLSNTSASTIFVKFYDKATAPTSTDVPKRTIQIPANATVIRAFPNGLKFSTGFGWSATGGVADNDSTAIAANCVVDFSLNS
ncbi:MAG: hypothetical protein ACRDZY_22175, partial [Acidimicrobiales bacterium]